MNRVGPTAAPTAGRNNVNWIVEHVQATPQMGTHLDGLNHLQVGDRTYNGHRLADIVEEHGTNRLGIETLPQVVTRGLLLDVAAVRGVDRLEPGDVDHARRCRGALRSQSARPCGPGDAVLFHTGLGPLWDDDPAPTPPASPDPAWRSPSGSSSSGSRSPAATPGATARCRPRTPTEPFVVPQTLNIRHGVVVLENLRLRELAADGVAEFLFVRRPPEAARRHRRVGRAARHRLTRTSDEEKAHDTT